MKSEMKLVLQHTTKVLTPHSSVRRAASEQVREAYQFGCGCWNSEGNKFNENDETRDFQIEGISSWQNSDSGSVEASSSSSRGKNGDPPSIIRLERVYYSTKTIPYHYSHDSSKTALQGSVSSTCDIEFQPSFIPQQKQVKTFRKETCKALHAEKKVFAISQTSVARPVKRKADCSSGRQEENGLNMVNATDQKFQKRQRRGNISTSMKRYMQINSYKYK